MVGSFCKTVRTNNIDIIDSDGRTMRINSGSKGNKYFARQQSIRPYITLTGEDLAEFRRHVLKTYKVFR